MYRTPRIIRAVALCAILAGPIQAANELTPLDEIKPTEKPKGLVNPHGFQYGLSAANTLINDSAYLKGGYFLGNYRPYFRYLLNEQHTFNLRGRIEYGYNRSLTDAQRLSGGTESTGLYALELFNTELNFGNHRITTGRAFYKSGRGLLFANFADGAEYRGEFRYLRVTAMAAYSAQYSGCTISLRGCGFTGQISQKGPYDVTPGRTIDANLPDAGKRLFSALEAESPQLFGSSLYALVFHSYDFDQSTVSYTDANAGKVLGQRYTFQPLYSGIGLSGYIVTPRLRYLTEGIYETGTTYNRVNTTTYTSEKANISAWAVTADLNYALPVLEAQLKPGLILQYATGSGRQEKAGSGANSANPSQENGSGTDMNFFYFGYYSAGLALKPKLSNLHVIRGGFQLRPLRHFHWGRDLMAVVKYSYYHKQNSEYVISDPRASVPTASVGHGLDLQLVYDFSSDLKIFYAYGAFLPGAAFPSREPVQIHILSLNLLF